MSGPICHWLLWEWHQRWPPLTPADGETLLAIVFHYGRRESADKQTDMWNGKMGKLEKAFRPVVDLSCFGFPSAGFYEMSIWPINKAVVTAVRVSPPTGLTEDKGSWQPHALSFNSLAFPPLFFFFSPPSSRRVSARQSGDVCISLKYICRVSY